MKNKVLLLLLVILVLPSVLALSKPITTAQPVFQQNLPIDLRVPCALNGAFCPTTTECNLTVVNPDGLELVNSVEMTQIGSLFNYTLNETQSVVLGEYEVAVSCCDNGDCNNKLLSFLVTPSGAEPVSSGQGSILLGILGIMLLVAVLFFVTGFRAKNPAMKTFGFAFGSIMILIMILYSLVILNEVVAGSPSLVSGFETFYFVMKMVGTVGILAIVVITFLVLAKAWKIKRGLIDR